MPLRFYYSTRRMVRVLARSSKPYSGAKITWRQLFHDLDLLQFFLTYQDARFVVLQRKTMVDALCSGRIAAARNLWNSKSRPAKEPEPFAIDAQWAKEIFRAQYFRKHMIWSVIDNLQLKALPVFYEPLFEHPVDELARIASFMEVKPFEAQSSLVKLVATPYAALVTNYNELLAAENEIKQQFKWPLPEMAALRG